MIASFSLSLWLAEISMAAMLLLFRSERNTHSENKIETKEGLFLFSTVMTEKEVERVPSRLVYR